MMRSSLLRIPCCCNCECGREGGREGGGREGGDGGREGGRKEESKSTILTKGDFLFKTLTKLGRGLAC